MVDFLHTFLILISIRGESEVHLLSKELLGGVDMCCANVLIDALF